MQSAGKASSVSSAKSMLSRISNNMDESNPHEQVIAHFFI